MHSLVSVLAIVRQLPTILAAVVPSNAPIPYASEPAAWAHASSTASDFVAQLKLEEKIGLVTGSYGTSNLPCVGSIAAIERLGFEGMCFSDGPAGYARSDGVSVFASGLTAAATWDRRLMYERAVAIGEEFRDKGAHVHLGPSTGPMGRHAQGGRNWEGFGPDPYLAGVAMNASVRGIQSTGVQACSKHYIGNEQETQRVPSTLPDGLVIDAISANMDDRTLHELYLWPFADAVHAGTASVMCSYNRVNQTYSCENSDMLRNILKTELGFPGYIVSDWSATHSTSVSANSGLDMEMPGNVSAGPGSQTYFGDSLLAAVKEGAVSEDRLNDMAVRVMTPYFLLGQNQDFPSVDPSSGPVFVTYQYGHNSPLAALYPETAARDVRGTHAESIRELGAAATVLLKNVGGALPLKNLSNIGLFGNDAPYPTTGSVYQPNSDAAVGFKMGTLAVGGGSGTVRHTSLVTPQEAIQAHVKSLGGRVQLLFDNNEIADGRLRSIYPTPQACLLFLKSFATEGVDRPNADLQWNATMAVESLAAICPNTIVITHGAGVDLMPWADNENVTAILAAQYPGEETGNAIVDVLWGAVEPSGRLPFSIPYSLVDYGPPLVQSVENSTDPNAWQANFIEGQMIDYRHFDTSGIEARYEFGFGLSYTTFTMGDSLDIQLVGAPLAARADRSLGMIPGGLKDLWHAVAVITVSVANTGQRAGVAVPQLYMSLPLETTPEGTPLKVLRGFEKIYLQPGVTRTVSFELLRRDLSYWSTVEQQWVIPEGSIRFMAGFSSKDLRVTTEAEPLRG